MLQSNNFVVAKARSQIPQGIYGQDLKLLILLPPLPQAMIPSMHLAHRNKIQNLLHASQANTLPTTI